MDRDELCPTKKMDALFKPIQNFMLGLIVQQGYTPVTVCSAQKSTVVILCMS